ncbi:MAG: amidohydrolase family protein [Pseudomonadota bacterium]
MRLVLPDFAIVDSHVHLYDPAVIDFPWMADVPKLQRAHGPADYHSAVAPVDVAAAVFLEVDAGPGRHMDEARFVTDLGKAHPFIKGMVASMPLEKGPDAVAADLEAYAQMPLARGVRRLIERHTETPGWALQPAFVAAVQSLPRYGLTFDICVRYPQLADAIELVRCCPEVSFVLDHMAKPGIADGLNEPWRTEMATLAREPNVVCKISGVVTEADHSAWTHEDVAPYIDHAIDCFGFDRVMFGGDWPVLTLASDYPRWVESVDRVVAGASSEDTRKLYRDNAIAFYRLDMADTQ